MEVPYYFVLDALSTIRLHARIRNFLSEVHVFRREGPRIQRLTLVTVIDGWPVLKRLCVRCKWGLPPFDGPLYDLTYLKTIVDLSILLVDRSWEANVAFFLAHVRPPPNVEVIALLLCNRQFVRHSLFSVHRFHPKLVVPVLGDPLQAVYGGDQILPYIDNLLCVVSEPPRDKEFWRKIREFVDRRTLLPDLFLSDGRDLLRLK
ncbi:hypothetical protein VNI00_018417 [Paramarasmius palmivorus]|uniref:Uncharacterized protein n=1 Tax=Paramarasmius palmivorus TaxID=297713 RepID=A0AAW0AXW5_9AGAR